MALIPFLDLSYGTDMSQDYRGRRIDFDEGYSQRAKRKNGAPQVWRLVWDHIRDDVAEELRLFFEERQGVGLVRWTPYNQSQALKWTASRWASRPSGFLIQDCSVVLTQEFDLPGPIPVNTAAPSITGNIYVGETLTAVPGTYTNTPTSFNYQWKRNGAAIPGALDQPTYVLGPADQDQLITVTETATNVDGEAVATSAAVGPIRPASPFSDYQTALNLEGREYWRDGIAYYENIAALPGYFYARTGAKGELNASTVTYGATLVTNGTFTTNTTGWTFGNGGVGTINNGRLRLAYDATGTFGPNAYQSIATVVGKSYRVIGKTFAGIASSRSIRVGTAAAGSQYGIVTDADLDLVFIATTATTFITAINPSSGAGQANTYSEYDDLSLQEVILDAIDDFATNVPGIVPGVGYWSRQQATNLLLQSQAFDNASWAGSPNIIVTPNAVVAPDGTMTADTLADDNSGVVASHGRFQNITVAGAGAKTASVFAKAGKSNWLEIVLTAFDSTTTQIWFDLQNGTVGSQLGAGVGYIQAVGNGWYRCTVVMTVVGPDLVGQCLFYVVDSNGQQGTTANATHSIHLWQAQALDGEFRNGGPLITTTTAAATVGADDLELGAALPNGDFIIWGVVDLPTLPIGWRAFEYNTAGAGGTIERVLARFISAGTAFEFQPRAGNVLQPSPTTIFNAVQAGRNVVGVGRRNGKYIAFTKRADGVITIRDDASGTGLVPAVTALEIGTGAAATEPANGKIKGFYQRDGTFDDPTITAILQAA